MTIWLESMLRAIGVSANKITVVKSKVTALANAASLYAYILPAFGDLYAR